MSSSIENICDLSRMYNESYQYSLPQEILKSFLLGKAFDNQEIYTDEESQRLRNDINEIFQSTLKKNFVNEKSEAIITAGSPGAGKTTKLNQYAKEMAEKGKDYPMVCPDDTCLKNQKQTYLADIASSDGSVAARQSAYNKWRPGSNAAAHLILGNLIREKYTFYFGSTSSGPRTYEFFDFLKKQGYTIKLIHVSASDEVRWESIKARDESFVQTTEKDVTEKGLLLPQRIKDTFLKYADEIEFYYRGEVKQDAVLAATWLRNEEGSEKLGTLQIFDKVQYENVKSVHNAAIRAINKPELLWGESVEDSSLVQPNSIYLKI
jgi:predicted ABC-type ATPase